MTNKMLIDAAHPEETRVVVIRGNRVEEFDYESTFRKQLRGNIYLAKVTRVEPSLQAAFVDYGGNRHGFLAFNEIHPDYYQIPEADKKAMLKAEAEELTRWEEKKRQEIKKKALTKKPVNEPLSEDDPAYELVEIIFSDPGYGKDEPWFGEDGMDVVEIIAEDDDPFDEMPPRPKLKRKHYRIQEVIKRNQIILIQVSKEERGNKGAALTTYLSLAGRFTVLMPNTERGGGISRKIENASDRKRLREVMDSLNIPDGMGLIIRTAGASKTKIEVKRDYDYLLRLWESIRTLTLKSSAPALTYEEGNLIKRSVRDLYDKDISEIIVSGERPYREAKAFMRTLMPSHAKNVKPYKDHEPIFMRHQVERQLNAMFSPFVTLKSGGYIVINQTEALVAIDVNSGKSTKEKSIEETALSTNLEAAEEISRQLRLRDMAGLIVIDFIDMNERRNNRSVEKKVKDCLRQDRARIQVGRISTFGLMEMSRQRMRTGVLEGSTTPCEHCQGTGMIRSTESVALYVLRSLEDVLMNGSLKALNAITSVDVALYILNRKREYLQKLEEKYNCTVMVTANAQLLGANFSIEKVDEAGVTNKDNLIMQVDWAKTAPGQQARDSKRGNPRNNNKKSNAKQRPERRKPQHNKTRNEDHKADNNKQENTGRPNSKRAPQQNKHQKPAQDKKTDKVETTATEQPTETKQTATKEENTKPRRRRRNTNRQDNNKQKNEQATPTEETKTVDAKPADSEGIAPEKSEEKKTRKPRAPRRGPRKKNDVAIEQKPESTKANSADKVSAEKAEKPASAKAKPAKEKPAASEKKAEPVNVPAKKTEKPAAEIRAAEPKAEAEKPKELASAEPGSKRKGWWSRPS